MKELLKKYSHAWVFSYGFVYMSWFGWLEDHVTEDYYVIESVLDQYIPFMEIFIIPYLLWFVYCFATLIYFFLTDKTDFYKAAKLTVIGMTIFLVICTIFPNGQHLRPTHFANNNIFTDLVRMVYQTDTPTNVLPSLHAFNSIACYIAISHNERLRKHRLVQGGSFCLTVLIVLSTVFLKQHSILDVIAAFIMVIVLYPLAYQPEKLPNQKTVPLKQRVV